MPRAKVQQESDNAAKTSAAAIRIRENQRRSRARRKEYVEGMQRKLQDYETKGVAATLEMQQAARDVAIENSRLRLLLAHNGISGQVIDGFLQSFNGQDSAEAEEQLLKMQAAMPSTTTGTSTSTMATLFPEHAHVDKLAVLASASVQQSWHGADSNYSLASDDSTTAPSTGPVTPSSSAANTPSSNDQDFDSPMEMSCDAAAQIIARMQGCGERDHPKANLGCHGQGDYLVQNSAFLQILEAASFFN
ncbi:hypothetical protein PT974_07220 [Cladobotryum mycophilum]|uniref:BZIP domain-containing protein n=1 Tax=Cladobotryum mycophilum TaxID=491253 RepID=A0ABR0SNW8_9HYPO